MEHELRIVAVIGVVGLLSMAGCGGNTASGVDCTANPTDPACQQASAAGTGGASTSSGSSGASGSSSSSTGASTGSANCVPGQSIACIGPGGCEGGQVCLADGSGYGACDCGGSSSGAAGSGGTIGSASSSTATGSTGGSTGSSSSGSTGSSSSGSGSGSGSTGVSCPAPDPTTTIATLPPFNGPPDYPVKQSGEVTAYMLPRLPPGKNMEWVDFGETPRAYTPSPYLMTVSFSPCPGVFTPKANAFDYCNGTTSQTNGSSWQWAEQSTYASYYAACYAPPDVQYYMNVKWTYTSCAQGAAECGFSISTGG